MKKEQLTVVNQDDALSSQHESGGSTRKVKRPRSLTTLKLEVIAERARKIKRLREAYKNGNYNVSSTSVSQHLLGALKKQ